MTPIDPRGRDCRLFTGYKPCRPGAECTDECRDRVPFGTRVLIVNLDALGNVLMTTAQLAGVKREWPESTVVWLTAPEAVPLLQGNPYLDGVYAWHDENRMVLSAQRFDVVLNADKSVRACAFTASLDCPDVRGFTLSHLGQIVPANDGAEYAYRLGLDDRLKFRVNKKTGQEILAEAWGLPYRRDEYVFRLTSEEEAFCTRLRQEWGLDGATVVGLNTGCSNLFPNKKMTVGQHVSLIERLAGRGGLVFLLLGGREDTARNAEIARRASASGARVIETPTTEGLRRGACYENLADIVVTGDSFGMHLAIALRKHVAAWFGLSCWEEIDLYDRGVKFHPDGLACAPCWQRVCPHNLECIAAIDLEGIAREVEAFADARAAERGAA
ncbi:MAG: glycosyltransferase family 9 protein [Bacteroidota bacterium]|nr:glycosyltransferase family 9 protein [Bacteroidota bacterium]